MKRFFGRTLAAALAAGMIGCYSPAPQETTAAPAETTAAETAAEETAAAAEETTEAAAENAGEQTELMVAAAASLQYVMEDEIKPAFEAANPDIALTFTFDSSGKLQTQIEEGAPADVFFSAAKKQMTALQDESMIDADSVVELLENKITLIVPKGSETGITGFEDITKAENIAIGDPESVPAGQYAQEAFESLGMWEDVQAKASLGTNVTEVLSWVSEGSADAGVVYLTDATTSDQADKIDIIGYAPEGSCKKVIYPVGIVSASEHKEAAAKFIEYLQTEEGLAAFEKYGFSPNAQ